MGLFWTLHSGEPIEFPVLLERLGEPEHGVAPLLKAWRQRGWIESYDSTLWCTPDGTDAFNRGIELARTVEEKGVAIYWMESVGETVALAPAADNEIAQGEKVTVALAKATASCKAGEVNVHSPKRVAGCSTDSSPSTKQDRRRG